MELHAKGAAQLAAIWRWRLPEPQHLCAFGAARRGALGVGYPGDGEGGEHDCVGACGSRGEKAEGGGGVHVNGRTSLAIALELELPLVCEQSCNCE